MPRPSGRAPDADARRDARAGLSPNMPRARASPASATPMCCAPPRSRTRCRPSCAIPGAAGSRRNTACCRARPTPAPTARRRAAGRSGRTQEIQRLIGRSLRAVTDLARAGRAPDPHRLRRAPGRRRHAHRRRSPAAMWRSTSRSQSLVAAGALPRLPLDDAVAAVSCGIIGGEPVLDLDYAEDSHRRGRRQFRPDRHGRHRRDPGDRREREPFAESAVRAHAGAGAQRHRASCSALQRKALGLA